MSYDFGNPLWDLMALIYDYFYKNFPPYQTLLKTLTNNLEKETINPIYILDAGCGTGLLSFEIAKRNFYVIGVDKSMAMLNIARKKRKKENLNNLNFIYGDLNNDLHFLSKYKFNKVFLIHSLYLLKNPEDFLKKVSSLLSPSGEIFICNPLREITMAELISGGRLFVKEILSQKRFFEIYFFLLITFAMGFLNVIIQKQKKKRIYHCWNLDRLVYILKQTGFKVKWTENSCLAYSHLLICAIKED